MYRKNCKALLLVLALCLTLLPNAVMGDSWTPDTFTIPIDTPDPSTAPVYSSISAAQADGFTFSLSNGKPFPVPAGYDPSKNGFNVDRRVDTTPVEGFNYFQLYYNDYGSVYSTFHYNSTVHGALLQPFDLSLAHPTDINPSEWVTFPNMTHYDHTKKEFVMMKRDLGVEYIPVTQVDGLNIYQWYDGSYFCLAKDGCNIMRLDSTRYTWSMFNSYDAQRFRNALKPFEAMLGQQGSYIAPTTTTTTPETTTTTPVTTTPAVTSAPGLVAHYKFENTLTDATGKGHDGTGIGSVAYASGGASGQALKLENGGYVKIPGSDSLNLGEQFTLNAWVKLAAEENDVNRYNTVIFKEHPTEPGYFIYKAVASGTHDVRLDIQQLSTGFEPVVSTDGVGSLDLSSKWTMVTWVSDGDTLYVYVDGKLQSTGTTGKKEYGTPFSDTVSSNLFIGGPKANSAELFNGQIDEVKLFSKALSGSEIKAEYDAVKSGGSHVLQLWIDQYRIVKDNQETAIDSAPVILNGRTMVPVRPVIEAMGGTVAYDPATRRIDLAFKGRTLTLWIDKYEAVVNGQTVTLEVAPTVINGRTMLPLRFAAESLGAGVEWDKTTQKITLKYE